MKYGHWKSQRPKEDWTATRFFCCFDDLGALNAELFVYIGSGEQSEVVQLEKRAKALVELVAWLSSSLWVLSSLSLGSTFIVLKHRSEASGHDVPSSSLTIAVFQK